MSKCSEFLLKHTPPNVPGVLERGKILDQNRYKVICQTLSNVRRFVTLYDTQNRIPVFSAFKYTGVDGGGRPKDWKIEPQLEDIGSNKNMIPVSKNKTYNNQAGDIDYKNHTVYNRGHLFPCSYGMTENDRKATFTLTNIVPQVGTFNKGSWQKMESCVKCVLDEYCKNNDITEGFLVIGAQPGNKTLNNRVNIPSMLWSAFCCYSQSENTWLAAAHWGENIKDSSKYLQTKTLAELYKKLSTQDSYHICPTFYHSKYIWPSHDHLRSFYYHICPSQYHYYVCSSYNHICCFYHYSWHSYISKYHICPSHYHITPNIYHICLSQYYYHICSSYYHIWPLYYHTRNLYISPCYHHIFPSQYNICPSHNYNWPRYYDNQYSLNYCYYYS
ncbi:uncharacterized protein LOC125884302 [Epinephelus fuscoguttatus]|uniref:uncharacterized protein LOC125884302 n=1 Tax=Epinephelus fuscoguttatus TaxID=293821 RepID=UPI0020D1AFA9|nr:uncharacterized protein LOC125884302 [Epinephelus fuscoguttatus]